jgi:hypothetical protein
VLCTPFTGWQVDFGAELKLGSLGQHVREEAHMGSWWSKRAPSSALRAFQPPGCMHGRASGPADGDS